MSGTAVEMTFAAEQLTVAVAVEGTVYLFNDRTPTTMSGRHRAVVVALLNDAAERAGALEVPA